MNVLFMTMERIIFFSLWIFSRKMTIGEISLLGFSGTHLNVNTNEGVLKMLKTHKGVEKEKEFPYEVCKGCVAPDCVHQHSEESSQN